VTRLATFQWRTPPPTSVDEVLAVYDDGIARLVVRRPRFRSPSVGTFQCQVSPADLEAVAAAGPGPVIFDMRIGPDGRPEFDTPAAGDTAEQLSVDARASPLAVADFYAQAQPPDPASGRLSVVVQVVARGTDPVEFELDPSRSAVHFSHDGQPLAWREWPDIPIGFTTPDAQGLGGLRSPAAVRPGQYGALVFEVPVEADAASMSVQVSGWLVKALADEPMPEPFEIQTAPVDIPG
jgi:hypothetical protein